MQHAKWDEGNQRRLYLREQDMRELRGKAGTQTEREEVAIVQGIRDKN
jgi:hypothetical protein